VIFFINRYSIVIIFAVAFRWCPSNGWPIGIPVISCLHKNRAHTAVPVGVGSWKSKWSWNLESLRSGSVEVFGFTSFCCWENRGTMKHDLSTGIQQADLRLKYQHHEGGIKGGFKLKDFQVASAEFVGTFFLAFIVSMTHNVVNGTSAESVPMAVGFGLAAIVYFCGPISGGMVNPAVTMALVTRNKLNVVEAAYCMLFQCFGAIAAGSIAYGIYNSKWTQTGYPALADSDRLGQAFVAEMLQTFALASAVLNTATTTAQANNSYYGIAIGFVVLSGALVIGGVTGGCFNPAVGLLAFLHDDFSGSWVFIAAPLVGGFIAGLVFRITNPTEWDLADPLAVVIERLPQAHLNPNGSKTRMAAMLMQEFIGTFFWAWVYALSVNSTPSGGMLAVGAIVVSVSYMGGAVSGAHYNPATTVAVYLRGLKESPQIMRGMDCLLYIVVQLAAACAAGATASYVNNGLTDIRYPSVNYEHHGNFEAIVTEMILTFGLVLCVLSVGTNEKVGGNSYYGMAIGFFVVAAQVCGDDITGAPLNPALGEYNGYHSKVMA
jgi:aquaporin Z